MLGSSAQQSSVQSVGPINGTVISQAQTAGNTEIIKSGGSSL